MRFTVLGGTGLIGRHLARYLQDCGHEVTAYGRDLPQHFPDMGHVINCIGLTADFRKRPVETVEAQAWLAAQLLHRSTFESWLYLSSTRVYGGLGPEAFVSEENGILLTPSADSIYDLSKLLGESICLGHENRSVRVARISNVYSRDQKAITFLGSVINEIKKCGTAVIREAPESSKDYIAIDDVVRLLVQISLDGKERLYNVASGVSTTHRQIAERLSGLTGSSVTFAPDAAIRAFPRISISRVRDEFSFAPRSILDDIRGLV